MAQQGQIMKKLDENEFVGFIDELRDLCHKYTAYNYDMFWSTEDNWSSIELQIPRQQEEEE